MPNRIKNSQIPDTDSKLDSADLTFPWNAILYTRNESGLFTVHHTLCAATLVGKSSVITSASCLLQPDKTSSMSATDVIVVLNPSSEFFSENLKDENSRTFNASCLNLQDKIIDSCPALVNLLVIFF